MVSFSPQFARPRPTAGLLGDMPDLARLGPFKGPKDTLRAMERIALGPRGEQSPVVRRFTEWATEEVFPKDYLGEIIAIRNIFLTRVPSAGPGGGPPTKPLFRYMNDPRHVEWIKDPQRMVEEIARNGSTTVDCDEISVMAAVMGLQLGREVEFVALGFSPRQLTHVATRIKEPKSEKWIFVDPVAGPPKRFSPGA